MLSEELLDVIWRDYDSCKKHSKSCDVVTCCEQCGKDVFEETADCETFDLSCVNCGLVQCVSNGVNLGNFREAGRTVYDSMLRFEYWISLSDGSFKRVPKVLKEFAQKCKSNTELKNYLNQKENRKYRKYYGCILKIWEPDLVPPLTNCEIESLKVNFSHLRRNHNPAKQANGRKKSLPHYVYIMIYLLQKIGREDLASNFFMLRCKNVQKKYEKFFETAFPK